jgi:chaperone required for assembly of F1-ATPase
MKRFYKDVTVTGLGPFAIHLDGRPIKTPRRATLALPTKALAEAVAGEWLAQGDEVRPATMPFTKLANAAIDRVMAHEGEVVGKIMAYTNDLLCYRVDAPAELVARQDAEWNPLLDWAATRFGAHLKTQIGLAHFTQPDEVVAALRQAVESDDPFALTALHNAATILHSLVLTLAVAEGRLSAAEAFALSQLDERYQAEHWGEDDEAAARARAMGAELAAVERFIRLSKP